MSPESESSSNYRNRYRQDFERNRFQRVEAQSFGKLDLESYKIVCNDNARCELTRVSEGYEDRYRLKTNDIGQDWDIIRSSYD